MQKRLSSYAQGRKQTKYLYKKKKKTEYKDQYNVTIVSKNNKKIYIYIYKYIEPPKNETFQIFIFFEFVLISNQNR